MVIREFRIGDEPALHEVFYSAIHQVAIRDYTPEQINAWAPDTPDDRLWVAKMRQIQPFVALEGSEVIGYADVQVTGYIDHFFVSAKCQRRGVGRRLMERIHDTAHGLGLSELTADVSRTAQPFFSHFGFKIVAQREPVIRGVAVPNALMRKDLVPGHDL